MGRLEQKLELEKQIKALKIGEQLKLVDGRQQRRALEIAGTLFRAGVIAFKLHTFSDGNGGFIGVAVTKKG